MKTVQMILDEALLTEVDQAIKQLGTTRSEFTRQALRMSLKLLQTQQLEEKHRLGYEKNPVQPGEFNDWEEEQVWGD